jgi:diguanylate cyclase (GGDEF)-like protein
MNPVPETDPAASEQRGADARPPWAYLALTAGALLLVALARLLAPAFAHSDVAIHLIGAASVGALGLAAWHSSRRARAFLLALAAGQTLLVVSDILADEHVRLFGSRPFPSLADPLHLVFYPCLLAAIGLLIHERGERRSRGEAERAQLAFHDALTGLPNRALFLDRVGHALAGRRREDEPVAIMLLDVDDFNSVNDGLGNAVGDAVLCEIGGRLCDFMRPADTAARLAGDEFAVLIRDADSEQAIEVAERMREQLQEPIVIDGHRITVVTSIGIAFSTGSQLDGAVEADELLRNADVALYQAKDHGKGHCQVFEPEMHAQALARHELKQDLQRGFEAGEFTLRYQPIMDLRRKDIAGMEALVRWEHPQRGLVSPLDFVPVLESTGMIVPIGRHILVEACRRGAELQRLCPRTPPLSMAVNVSASQLQRPEFIEEVREALEQSGIVPASLTLELTESVMIEDTELSLLRLKALRALGVKLAIDDFGTGYSSLNYIRQLPVDILKIDRSFLADPKPEVVELTEIVVQLARVFKLQAVAEGIETPTQLSNLLAMHCDFGQGFHFAEPLTGEDMRELLMGSETLPDGASGASARSTSPQLRR